MLLLQLHCESLRLRGGGRGGGGKGGGRRVLIKIPGRETLLKLYGSLLCGSLLLSLVSVSLSVLD
jgi:hypothetical protein